MDRRAFLKIKLKTLMDEARIIRSQADKSAAWLKNEMLTHKNTVVRRATRNTLLAYGFLRGKAYWEMEWRCRRGEPNWAEIKRMCDTYGVRTKAERDRFDIWLGEAKKWYQAQLKFQALERDSQSTAAPTTSTHSEAPASISGEGTAAEPLPPRKLIKPIQFPRVALP